MENIYDSTVKNDLTYGRGYVYSLQYYIVWCTKYRRRVLTGGIDETRKRYLCRLAEQYIDSRKECV